MLRRRYNKKKKIIRKTKKRKKKNETNWKDNYNSKYFFIYNENKLKMAILLDGKKIANQIKKNILKKINNIKLIKGKIPALSIILIGNNTPSIKYVKNKINACKEVQFNYKIIKHNKINEEKLLNIINKNNLDKNITGLIIQLPLPDNINVKKIINKINLKKDVDGLNLINYGKTIYNFSTYIPATPMGILELLKIYKIKTEGKNCVIIGKSYIVGMPLNILMNKNSYPGNSTVTICDKLTQNISYFTINADILIIAVGQPEIIKKYMIKKGSVIIDVGINYIKNNKLKFTIKGDVDFKKVSEKCKYITPVPGGVGPMTIASLLLNTLKASK